MHSFAKGNPGLAKYILLYPDSTVAKFQSYLEGHGFLKAFDFKIFELTVAPLEAQWEDEVPSFDVGTSFHLFPVRNSGSDILFQAIRNNMLEKNVALPQVYHVENAVSFRGSERTARAYQQVWDEMGIGLSGHFPTISDNQSDILRRGVSHLMTVLTNKINQSEAP